MTLNKSEKLIKILIVEDHEFTRTGLKYSLQNQDSIQVVSEAENGLEAIQRANDSNPDIILMDIGMPQMDGIAATQAIKAEHPEMKIIMLSSRQFSEEIFAALSSGADAYCMKDISLEKLLHVFETVMDDAVWLDPAIARIVATGLSSTKTPAKRQSYNTELTDREQEVLAYIAQGKANKDIACSMGLSIHTVKTYVRSLIQKLAVDDRTQVALKALKEGLIEASRTD
jgi:DNA-binding NarL/FixJ family response regulator